MGDIQCASETETQHRSTSAIRTILVDRLDVHGDVLVATSILPGLQKKYPGAAIDWHVRFGFDFALLNNPRIRAIVRGPVQDLAALHSKYDLVVTPEHHYRWNKPMAAIHCDCAGVEFNPPELYFSHWELAAVSDNLRGRILIATKAGWHSRQCPYLVPALERIAPLHPEFLQVDRSPDFSQIEKLSGSLREVAAVMRFAKLYIGIDTVFMHMAVALGVPMVLVLGPTGPETQYIPKAAFIRPFVNMNPVESREEYRYGIQVSIEEIINTIRTVLAPDGTITEPKIEYNFSQQ